MEKDCPLHKLQVNFKFPRLKKNISNVCVKTLEFATKNLHIFYLKTIRLLATPSVINLHASNDISEKRNLSEERHIFSIFHILFYFVIEYLILNMHCFAQRI